MASPKAFRPTTIPSSVTSVASVRCFPLNVVSRTEATVSTEELQLNRKGP
jgi:hypothetical protein